MSGAGRPAAGTVDGSGLTLALAVTRWHAEITDSLLERALAAAKACGIDDPLVVRVPGAGPRRVAMTTVSGAPARGSGLVTPRAALAPSFRHVMPKFSFLSRSPGIEPDGGVGVCGGQGGTGRVKR